MYSAAAIKSAAELTAAIEAAVPDSVDTTVNYTPNTSALPAYFSPITRWVYYKANKDDLEETEDGETHAKGIKNSPNSHVALVSEEGPELI